MSARWPARLIATPVNSIAPLRPRYLFVFEVPAVSVALEAESNRASINSKPACQVFQAAY